MCVNYLVTFVRLIRKMRQKYLLILLFAIFSCSQTAFCQVNFFTDDEADSLATNFYQRNKKVTALVVGNLPSFQVGAALFLHNEENRASYFFETKSNFNRRYVINGVECYGEGTRQKEVAYTTSSFTVGLGRGFTRNWFIYGGVGVVVKQTEFDNKVEDNYRYTVPNHGVWFNFVGGAMYVLDNDLSVLAALDLYDRSLTFGFGYSW